MNRYTVIRAVQLAPTAEVGRFVPPKGFPLILDTSTMRLCEPAVLFLLDRRVDYIYPNGYSDAVPGEAHDLRDFFEFLDYCNIDWKYVSATDLSLYRDAQLGKISPTTLRPYSPTTVARRMATVLAFYRYAVVHRWVEREIDVVRPTRKAARSRETTDPSRPRSGASPSTIRPTIRRTNRVHPLDRSQLQLLFAQLGSLPGSGAEGDDLRLPVRDRLIVEVPLNTGLRRIEVRHLEVSQIVDMLSASADKPDNEVVWTILKRTKGQYEGKAMFPVWLVRALDWYIRHERTHVVHLTGKNPKELFLNPANVKNGGGPITCETISELFRRLALRAGLKTVHQRTDPQSGQTFSFDETTRTYHDLRHTYAHFLYIGLCEAGISHPWKIVQSLMRHRHLSTTTDIYLNDFASPRAEVTTQIVDYFNKLVVRDHS